METENFERQVKPIFSIFNENLFLDSFMIRVCPGTKNPIL